MPQKQSSKANLYCFRCQVKLGKILNRGTFCPLCRRKICKKCLASSNNSIYQTNQLHHTLINYQLINQKSNELNGSQTINGLFDYSKNQLNNCNDLSENNNFLTINNNLPKNRTCLNNNNNVLSDKNLSNESTKTNLPTSEPNEIDKNVNDDQNTQTNKQANDQQVPKKVQRKNTGLYIKRAASSTADSLVARKYRSNLRNNQQEIKSLNNNKQLSKSCTELTAQQPNSNVNQVTSYCPSERCISEQNLNKPNCSNDNLNDDENFDKSASLPKFNLNRLISKLKRSHTVHNIDDIGKRSTLLNYQTDRFKNQFGQKSNTLWSRSSAVGHQLYLKTLNLGKKGLFKRRSQSVAGIPICKLKGICSFCCKKM